MHRNGYKSSSSALERIGVGLIGTLIAGLAFRAGFMAEKEAASNRGRAR